MIRRRLAGMLGVLGLLSGSLIGVAPAHAQQIHRNGFETMKMGWLKGGFDAPYDEKTHAISDQVAHEGRHSEYLQFDARKGTFINYAYPIGKAIVGDELAAGIWLRSNRPGMQLMARVVLPRERDPQNLDHLMTTTIRGDVYQQVGQWQHLQLTRPVQLVKQQQQLMQNKLMRAFDFTDAYIDGLFLNVFGGPGLTDVWIDDVEVGPISGPNPFVPAVRAPGPTDAQPVKTPTPRPESKGFGAEFNGDRLKVGGKPFLFRAIHVTDTPLEKLREARFNAVFLDTSANAALVREATDRGLWVVPMLRTLGDNGKPMPPDEMVRGLARFTEADVLFAHLGNTLSYEQAKLVARSAETVKEFDPGRVTGADVWDGMLSYSRTLNLVGVHRWPLMTTLELGRYRDWLRLRRALANPNVFLWTTVQTHIPEPLAQVLYERSADGSFDEPVGPQAEHIQLLTYTALSAGCRGLAFSSDRFLADSHQGRDRLLACALMNLELEMLEPLLAGADDVPEWAETLSPHVKAAVIRSPLGVLVLPVWEGPFSQYVPGQAAVSRLSITVPPMPQSMQAWEVSPADVRHLKAERVVGGTRVTLPEFGLTGAIVFTANNELVGRFQEQAKGRRQLASQWAHDMAAYELDKVMTIEDQLERHGHTLPDGRALIADAQRRLQSSRRQWENRAFPEAYSEAQRSLRPVRILMRAQWEKAVRGMDSPVASPYAASFFTLPRHWQFMDQVRRSHAGKNVLPGGDFELVSHRPEESWRPESPPSLDDVEALAQRVGTVMEPDPKATPEPAGVTPPEPKKDSADPKKAGQPEAKKAGPGPAKVDKSPKELTSGVVTGLKQVPAHEGKQCAMLRIQPKTNRVAPAALERTVVALSSPLVRLPPGTLVQVSGWICIPVAIAASPDGALLYDSAGGDAMAIRLIDPTPWKKFTVYRRVPASGTIQVTLALTGLGTVYFDDIRIEPLVPPEATTVPAARVVPTQ